MGFYPVAEFGHPLLGGEEIIVKKLDRIDAELFFLNYQFVCDALGTLRQPPAAEECDDAAEAAHERTADARMIGRCPPAKIGSLKIPEDIELVVGKRGDQFRRRPFTITGMNNFVVFLICNSLN